MRKDVQDLRKVLLQELLGTYSNPRAEGALTDFIAVLNAYAGAPELGSSMASTLGAKATDPDIIRAVLSELGEASPADMIAAATKRDSRVKASSFRAAYIRMHEDGELSRRKEPSARGGFVYRLRTPSDPKSRR